MDLDADNLRRQFAELSDEALLKLNPADLTDLARQYYNVELTNRGLKPAPPPRSDVLEPSRPRLVPRESETSFENLPWKSTAVSAAEFEYPEDAEQARDVLEAAAIPCALVVKEQDPSSGYKRKYRGKWIALMVPNKFLEAAQQRIRMEIQEPAADEDYARHFVEFTDQELLDADAESLPEGARKWYTAELKKRGLQQSVPISAPHQRPGTAAASGDDISVATLLQDEASVARRILERASIPCRVEREDSQGVFETFAIRVPASHFDQAAELLNRHEAEIFRPKPTEGEGNSGDRT